MKPTNVKALPGYKISVSFEDGTAGVTDLSSFIEEGIFTVLKDEKEFKKVYCTRSSIAWSDELEIDASAIYLELLQKAPDEVFRPSTPYASD